MTDKEKAEKEKAEKELAKLRKEFDKLMSKYPNVRVQAIFSVV